MTRVQSVQFMNVEHHPAANDPQDCILQQLLQ